MTKVFITGATGNVGMEVIAALQSMDHSLDLYAGVRDVSADKAKLEGYDIKLTPFDFIDTRTYGNIPDHCDIVYLLRPPQISDVESIFKPLVATCKSKGVKHVIFLSVQGVEKSTIIPHHKIERLIVDSQLPYTFLRPAYFMQNFTTTLRHDLVKNKRIYLPAGKAKFTLIDVRDIGQVSARILTDPSQHISQSYELTSQEKLNFSEMAVILSDLLQTDIRYVSPNLIRFFITKRKEKVPTMMILVMIMLHYFPRFQAEPAVADWVEIITNKKPIPFEQFVKDHRTALIQG
jgi:uncharacterized protein YbjT (DUF2867 family)